MSFLAISRFFLFASVFCVVVVLSATFFPFIGGKYYFFRIAVELSLAFLLLWWAFQAPQGELRKRFGTLAAHPLFRAVSVFVLVFMLAVIFADDPKIAFWSNYERGEGGFQMLHYYALFVLSGLLLVSGDDWRRIFKFSAVAAVLMILYGIAAAALLPNFVGPYRDSGGNPVSATLLSRVFSGSRFQGSLGNPAYVSPYLIFAMFYVFYLWFTGEARREWKHHLLYGGLIAFFAVFFVLSQTRGGFLGLAVAVPTFFLYLAFSDARFRKAAAIGIGTLVALGGLAYAFRGPLVANNIPGSRFLTISLREQTAQTRFWTWGSAWRGFTDRPLFGWGPENFSTVFDKHFDTRHYIPNQVTETWFDRAHGVLFDYLAETGILGLLSYLGMFAVFYYQFFKSGSFAAPPLRGLLFVMPVAYLVQALILFDVLPIYMNLFIVLAFAQYAFQNKEYARA